MSIKVFQSMKLQSLPLHPLLIAFFQILSICAINIKTVNITTVMFVLLITVFFTVLFFLLFAFITNDIKRSAILVSFYLFIFFTYGRLFDIVQGIQISELVIGRRIYLLLLYALIVIAGTLWILRSQLCKKYLEVITYFINVFSLGLFIVVVLIAITNFDRITFGSNKQREFKKFSDKKEVHQISKNNKILHPNVYYIIFDSYASHRVLNKYYDWDDSGVVEALRSLGFSVNKNAYSNYYFTSASLGATLNMRYMHEDWGFNDASSKEDYLMQHFKHNEVMERFKYEGYDVISNKFFGYNSYQNNKNSIYKSGVFADGFIALLVKISMLRVIEEQLMNGLLADAMRQDILSILANLKLFDIPNRPTFIFIHVLSPHRPFIFNADGSKPKIFESDWGRLAYMKGYIEQVRFIGTQVIEIANSLRRRDTSAVIIVQADHGLGYKLRDYLYDRGRPPLEFLDSQYGILSAIYLPHGIMIPEEITPVNLFRYLFNNLFDAKLEVLPDRAFFSSIKEPYAFYEVTNDLKRLRAE